MQSTNAREIEKVSTIAVEMELFGTQSTFKGFADDVLSTRVMCVWWNLFWWHFYGARKWILRKVVKSHQILKFIDKWRVSGVENLMNFEKPKDLVKDDPKMWSFKCRWWTLYASQSCGRIFCWFLANFISRCCSFGGFVSISFFTPTTQITVLGTEINS